MTTNRKANFQRHNRGKQASLTWDDGTLDHGAAHALAELMDRTAAPALRAMYNHHRDQLPKASTLYAAGANGYWIGCPRDLADEAERMVKAVQLVASLDHRASRCIEVGPADRGSWIAPFDTGDQSPDIPLVIAICY